MGIEQQAVGGREGEFLRVRAFVAQRLFELKIYAETGPLAFGALEADTPVHRFRQLSADTQTQACAAVDAAGAPRPLLKTVEQILLDITGDADARVCHRELNGEVGIGLFFEHDSNDDLAFVGEFDGIADEVDEYLAYSGFVAHQFAGDILVDEENEFQAFFVCGRRKQYDRIFEAFVYVEGDMLRFEFPQFEPGKIENVVDDVHQSGRGLRDELGQFLLIGVQARPEKQVREAYDAVHRRADFMAHAGEKLRFLTACLERPFPGEIEFDVLNLECLHGLDEVGGRLIDLVLHVRLSLAQRECHRVDTLFERAQFPSRDDGNPRIELSAFDSGHRFRESRNWSSDLAAEGHGDEGRDAKDDEHHQQAVSNDALLDQLQAGVVEHDFRRTQLLRDRRCILGLEFRKVAYRHGTGAGDHGSMEPRLVGGAGLILWCASKVDDGFAVHVSNNNFNNVPAFQNGRQPVAKRFQVAAEQAVETRRGGLLGNRFPAFLE